MVSGENSYLRNIKNRLEIFEKSVTHDWCRDSRQFYFLEKVVVNLVYLNFRYGVWR